MTSGGGCPRFAYVVLQRIRLSWVSEGKEKSMKTNRFLLLLCTMLSFVYCAAQNPDVQKKLGERYDNVSYSPEGGGWYLVSYQAGTKTLMGFCDKNGTMVCPNVEKTEKHKSWINLCVLDTEKKIIHDRWEDDMRNYNRDLDYYNKVESQYNAALTNYNNQVKAAKAEAERRWQNARDQAERNARANQKTSSSGGILGAIAQGIANAAAVTAAVDAVQYEPFEDQVISERGLYSAPVRPDNPKPTKPIEPANGYEWKPFTYLQPCPFDTIYFESIKSDSGRAIARIGNKFGVIDADLKTTVPFNYDELKEKNNSYECRKEKLWGVVMPDGNEKFPCMFTAINLIKMNGRDILLTNINDKCGAADFETAEAIVPNMYSSISSEVLSDKEQAFCVKKDNLYGVFGANGKIILDTKYPEIKFIHIEGSKNYYINVKSSTNVGLFDIKGNEIVPFDKCNRYEFVKNSFIKMYTPSGIQGVVGLDGTPIADLAYSNIVWDDTANGFIVTQYDKMGVISASGDFLFPMMQCESLTCEGDFFQYKDGVKAKSYGAIDYSGHVILQPKYASDKIRKEVEKQRKKNPGISTSFTNADKILTNSFSTASGKFVKE